MDTGVCGIVTGRNGTHLLQPALSPQFKQRITYVLLSISVQPYTIYEGLSHRHHYL